ncbi:MAG TPA: hypothetical protein VGA56_16005 [Opitutaceae bacterium]
MSQETVTYLTNIVIAAILACLITQYWLRQGRSEPMRYWMLSAWVLAVADVLFAARPELSRWIARILPTVLVTVGHAGLFFGARKTARLDLCEKRAIGMVLLHALGLIYFCVFETHSDWRKVFNGAIWAGYALGSCWSLRTAQPVFWKPLFAPANAFLLHGIFHCLRLGLGTLFALRNWTEASGWLQLIGDLEVSFFMVALFVGILVANLQLRNEELSSAVSEVRTLTGLLPICAWCKKVRDDDGYWQRVEDYFATRSRITFTHGICADCFEKQLSARQR